MQLHLASQPGSPAFGFGWARSFLDQISKQPIIPEAALQALLDGSRGALLVPAVRNARRLQTALEALAAEVRQGPLCLVHGDAHAGNIYRQADGALGLVDWQILQKGSWAMDVAYHLAAVLTPEDRRQHERALLGEYCAQLRAHGGPDILSDYAWRAYRSALIYGYSRRLKALGGLDIDANTAWRSYRIAIVYGYYMWAITRKVDPDITDTFVYRLGTAVHDLESCEALGA